MEMQPKESFQQWNERMSIKYDLSKWYDGVLQKLLNSKRRLKLICDICKSGRIADLGCGAGQQLDLIKRKFPDAECYGFDLSEYNIGRARELNSKVKWAKGDIEDMKGFHGHFDVVICNEVIEHVRSPQKLIQTVANITKTDAQIIFSIPNMDTVRRIKTLLKVFGMHKIFPTSFSLSDEWHVRHMNQKIFDVLIEGKLDYKTCVKIPHPLVNFWTIYEMKKC